MMAHVMSNFSQETGSSLDPQGSGGGQQGSSGMSGQLVYIVGGGGAAAGVVVMVVVLMMGVRAWRRRRDRRRGRYETDAETGQGRGEAIYDEIAEGKGGRQMKKKKKKDNKNKKKQKTTTAKHPSHDPDNNNDVGGLELATMDTAPDIITAHDNESIYETLDGRRAARAKTAHVTPVGQSENCHDCVCQNYPVSHPDFSDSTYDHLSRCNRPRRSPCLAPSVPEKRFTDPEVVTRTKASADPRAVHSADFVVPGHKAGNEEDARCKVSRGRDGCYRRDAAEPPPGTLTSSSPLTEMAQQSVCGGKRIVCQLTMVGVVENGKPVVPVKPAAASNAYFILERGRDSAERAEGGSQRSLSPPKFRFKTEGEAGGGGGGGGGSSAAGRTDYFILEPLSQREDLTEFDDVASSRASLGDEDCEALNTDVPDDNQCSLPPAGDSNGSSSKRTKRQGSFRNARVSSCPGNCSFADDADEASTSSPPKHSKYARSLSSPQSTSQHRRNHGEDANSIHQKMDSDLLKAQIRKEMIAFGFLNGSDDQNDGEKPGEIATSDCHSRNSAETGSPVRPPTNDYFLLEPQLDASMEESIAESSTPLSPPPCERAQGEKLRFYQRRQPPSHPHPPPLPKRNGHSRSKSEAPAVVCDGQAPQSSQEQGPVIVSLKKHGEMSQSGHAIQQEDSAECPGSEEAFRPRFKSESGIMPRRSRRC